MFDEGYFPPSFVAGMMWRINRARVMHEAKAVHGLPVNIVGTKGELLHRYTHDDCVKCRARFSDGGYRSYREGDVHNLYCSLECAEPVHSPIVPHARDGKICAMCKNDITTGQPYRTRLGVFCGNNCAVKKWNRTI